MQETEQKDTTEDSKWAQNFGGREALKSKGTRSEARQDSVVLGVPTLDRSPTKSPGSEVHIL